VSPHTPFLNDCDKRRRIEWLFLFLVNVFPLFCFHEFAGFAMADLKEQHVCVKFCFKLVKVTAEMHQLLKQDYGENSLSQAQTCNWFKHFQTWSNLD
jgi:hypothetical protein